MLSTEANFVKISAIFFSLACVAEVILPRLYNNVSEAASRSLFWTTNELNELPEVRFEFPFSLNSMAVLSSWAHERRSRGQQNSRAPQSPRGFYALARLYYLARPTKTATLRRLISFHLDWPIDNGFLTGQSWRVLKSWYTGGAARARISGTCCSVVCEIWNKFSPGKLLFVARIAF